MIQESSTLMKIRETFFPLHFFLAFLNLVVYSVGWVHHGFQNRVELQPLDSIPSKWGCAYASMQIIITEPGGKT